MATATNGNGAKRGRKPGTGMKSDQIESIRASLTAAEIKQAEKLVKETNRDVLRLAAKLIAPVIGGLGVRVEKMLAGIGDEKTRAATRKAMEAGHATANAAAAS